MLVWQHFWPNYPVMSLPCIPRWPEIHKIFTIMVHTIQSKLTNLKWLCQQVYISQELTVICTNIDGIYFYLKFGGFKYITQQCRPFGVLDASAYQTTEVISFRKYDARTSILSISLANPSIYCIYNVDCLYVTNSFELDFEQISSDLI